MPSHKADTTEDSNWVDWDGSPLTKQQWYDEIPDRQRKFRTLWERGYLIAKSVTITASPAHSHHLLINNVKEGSVAEPNPLLAFEKVDDSKADEAIPDAKKSRYTDAPDQLADADRDLFDELTASITDKQTRKDYKAATGASGINLLALLAAEMTEALTMTSLHGQRRSERNSWPAASTHRPSSPSTPSGRRTRRSRVRWASVARTTS